MLISKNYQQAISNYRLYYQAFFLFLSSVTNMKSILNARIMKNFSFKPYIPYISAILIFVAISFAYFAPDIFQNKAMYQNDVVVGNSMGQEAKEFSEKTGEKSLWTNSAFGGMPTYQIAPGYPSLKIVREIGRAHV